MVHSCRVKSQKLSSPTTTNSVETRTGGLIVLRYSWKYWFLAFSHNFNFVTNVSQFPWLLLDSQHNVRFVTSLRWRWREYVTCFLSALRRNSLWQPPVAGNYRKLGPFRRIIWFQGPSRARSASAGVGIAATPEYLLLVSLRLLFIRRLLLRLLVFLFFFTFLLFISRACEQRCWAETKGGWEIFIRCVPERPSPNELPVSVQLTGLLEKLLMPTTTYDNYRCMVRVCSKQTILTKRSFSCSFFVFLLLVVTRRRCLYILSSFILSIFLIRNKNEPRGWGSELETMLQFPARFGRIHLISWGLTTRVYGCEVHDFVGSFASVAHNVAQEIINGPQHGPGGSPVVRAAFIAVHNKSAALKNFKPFHDKRIFHALKNTNWIFLCKKLISLRAKVEDVHWNFMKKGLGKVDKHWFIR